MDSTTLQRFRINLARQKDNLLDWFQHTPTHKKRVHLGTADERSARAHLQVVEQSIAKTEENTLGHCTVCNGEVEDGRLEVDYTASFCLSHYSDEERRRLELDLELSQKLQKALLPQQIPDIPNLQIAAFTQPAAVVGGDYFDFFRFGDGNYGIVIADVMGKGVPASMLMASLQASLRLLGPESHTPGEVVSRLNRLFCHNISLTKFVTLFLGQYNPQSRTLRYTNAGHNPPLLCRAGAAAVEWLEPTGAAIGLIEGAEYDMRSVRLGTDDLLVLYTDGLTEAANADQEEFGIERLAEYVCSLASLSVSEHLRQLRANVQQFTGNRSCADDLTMMVLRHQ